MKKQKKLYQPSLIGTFVNKVPDRSGWYWLKEETGNPAPVLVDVFPDGSYMISFAGTTEVVHLETAKDIPDNMQFVRTPIECEVK